MTGFVKLHRSIFDFEWASKPNTLAVYVHLLALANFKKNEWNGITLKPGQLIISTANLAKRVQLTQQQTKTALAHLKATNTITSEATSKYTLITFTNWELEQTQRETPTNEATNELTNVATNQNENSNQPSNHSVRIYKNVLPEEEKKDIRNSIYSDAQQERRKPGTYAEELQRYNEANQLFEELWNKYPKKKRTGKDAVTVKAKLAIMGTGKQTMLTLIQIVSGWEEQFIPSAGRFFNEKFRKYIDDGIIEREAQHGITTEEEESEEEALEREAKEAYEKECDDIRRSWTYDPDYDAMPNYDDFKKQWMKERGTARRNDGSQPPADNEEPSY